MPTVPDSHKDLVENSQLMAIITTLGHDGFPQVTALGFLYDEDEEVFRLCVSDARQKFKNLKRQPECTIFLIDPANPFRTLEARCTAELLADDDYSWAGKIATRYGSSAEHVRSLDKPGERRYCVVLHPVKMNTVPPIG